MKVVERVLLVAAGLLLASVASAQVRQAEISGTITDQARAVLPGVTVSATHVGTQQTRTTVTDGTGSFLLTALPIGEYEIRAELSGFAPVVISGYRLSLGDSTRLDLTLQISGLEETITVATEIPLIDTKKSDLAGRIDQVQMEELPLSGRNWLNFATLAPGVKSDGSGGQPTAGVGDNRMSKVFVDGGSVQNLSTVAIDLEVSKEIVAEFEVITNRFDAVMGHAGTSVVNAVTKSGNDRFSGSAFIYQRDDSLNAEDFFTGRVEPYSNRQMGFTLGGPVVRGRTHFFSSYERQEEPNTKSSNTGIASLDAPVAADDVADLYFLRGDHSLTQNHRMSVRYNRFLRDQPLSDLGGTRPLSNSHNNIFETNRVGLTLNSVFGNRFVNTSSVTYLRSFRRFNRQSGVPDRETYGFAGTGDNQHTFPAVTIGGVTNVGNERPWFWYFRNDSSYFFQARGAHSLKFGGEWNHQYISGIFASNSNGTFFYDRNPANLATCCASGNQADWDKSQFPIPIRYTQALGDFFYDAPNDIISAFVQDDWSVSSRLTLNLGLRYDLEIGSLGHDQTGLVTNPRSNDKNNFQPRVGFAWDLLGTGRTIVRGGGGLYYDQVFLNVTFNQRRSNTGRQVSVTTFNTNNDPNFAFDPLGGRNFDDFIQTAGATNATRIGEDTEQPHVWTWSGGVAHQLTTSFAISADYVYQRSDSMLRSIDSNLFCCWPDGNPLPIRAGTFPELGGAVPGFGRPDPRFNAITDYTSLGKSRYHGLQLAANKRMTNNYQFGLSYLLSRNQDDHNGAFSQPHNPFNLADEYADSLQDQRHRFVANWVIRLPWEFNFSGILFAASGRAIGVGSGGIDINGDGVTGGDRPICGQDPRFNPGCSFLGIPNGERVPKNALRSDAVYRTDLRLARRFTFGRVAVDPSIEVFNLFNRQNNNPGSYNNNLTSANFGRPGRSALLPYLPRQAQVAVRMSF